MIKIDDCEIKFSGMGLFLSDEEWIHPERVEVTYEIIYVVSGNVYIKEEDCKYCLKKGDLLILKPGVCHGGFETSSGRTSFYWLHFHCDNFSYLPICGGVVKNFEKSYLFKEILHHWMARKNITRCEIILSYILSELFFGEESDIPKLAAEVFAWVHANASAGLSVRETGEHFGYNSEHLSRIIRAAYNCTLKALIDREIVSKANNYLLNSGYSVKEIAGFLGFDSANAFICFYKYHTKTTPTKYRNTYSLMKINKH